MCRDGGHAPALGSSLTAGTMGALFVRKFALSCNTLVRFSRILDSILELAVAVRKLLDYDVAAAA
jgi:hypothetical protein